MAKTKSNSSTRREFLKKLPLTTVGAVALVKTMDIKKAQAGNDELPYPWSFEECLSCGACLPECPEGAITAEEDSDRITPCSIDYDKCTACEECVNVCPAEVFEMIHKDTAIYLQSRYCG